MQTSNYLNSGEFRKALKYGKRRVLLLILDHTMINNTDYPTITGHSGLSAIKEISVNFCEALFRND